MGSKSLGRSVFAIAMVLGANTACERSDDKRTVTAPRERSQAIESNQASAPPAAPEPVASAAAPTPKKLRKLCGGRLETPGRKMPNSAISRARAPGEKELDAALPVGGGKWTWVNFWAAWCVPCKEEIPRLFGWEKKMAGDGKRFRVVFVSLDDDTRQMEQFLASEPAQGLRRTYWLREGEEREKWLDALGISSDPELPAHVLVDPAGKARCIVNGAIEDEDYPQLAALIGN